MSKKDYDSKNRLLKEYGHEVNIYEFYNDIFPDSDREVKGDTSVRKANPIVTYTMHQDNLRPLIMHDTTWEDGTSTKTYDLATNNRLAKKQTGTDVVRHYRNGIVFAGEEGTKELEMCENNHFALCGLCSYSGRRKLARYAYRLHGFVVDLDGVGAKQLEALWYYFTVSKVMPVPTYIVNSGNGLHVYYIFEEPVPLYPIMIPYLKQLYNGLQSLLYTRYSTYLKPENIQGNLTIYQCFRMVGSYNIKHDKKKPYAYKVRGFKIWKRVTLEYLNQYVDKQYQIPIYDDYSEYDAMEGHPTLEQCKELYPEWYENRIIKGNPPRQWVNSRGLYEWWIAKIQDAAGARVGNRYYCLAFLYAYAIKCNVPKEEADDDAAALMPFLQAFDVLDNPFTQEDLEAAGKYYRQGYSARISIDYIEAKTKIRIPRNRRNGQKQTDHLEEARAIRDIRMKRQGKNWRDGNGRPNKADIVYRWRKNNPTGQKADCIRGTGLDKKTVYKWWQNAEAKLQRDAADERLWEDIHHYMWRCIDADEDLLL